MSESLANLVVAILAVGGYSLQRAWDLVPRLENEGLADPKVVERLEEADVVLRLARSGYDRGPTVTTFMANRLIAAHVAARSGVLTQVSQLMREGRLEDAKKILCTVKGVGPMVFKQFAALEGVAK